MTDYATYLTARLASLSLSRNALARALGHRGASQVSRWCAGKSVPRKKAREAIDRALLRSMAMSVAVVPTGLMFTPQTPQDAPGATISGGEAPEGTPFVVERYVVEGG